MAYKKSRARSGLETAYGDINKRLRLVTRPGAHADIREYVIAAAIFLAHAEIENYISDVFSAFAKCAQAVPGKGSSLPPYLQAHLFIQKSNAKSLFSAHQAAGAEKDLLKSFSNVVRGSIGGFLDNATDVPSFNGKDIHTTMKYPSKDNLKKIFNRIGVQNIFDDLSALLKQDSVALLESLGSLRTQLAHTGTAPGISPKDVRDRIRGAQRFVGSIDRVIYRAVSKDFSDARWKANAC